jgi:hypothetical protein
MVKTQYGVKVPLAVDDYIWVTKDTGSCNFDLQPVLYDTVEEAEIAAEIWGPMAQVEPFVVDND